MNTESKAMAIAEAEKKIAAILAQLEVDQDVVIRGIELNTIEVTTSADDRRRLQQKVDIKVERLPGNNWST